MILPVGYALGLLVDHYGVDVVKDLVEMTSEAREAGKQSHVLDEPIPTTAKLERLWQQSARDDTDSERFGDFAGTDG